MEFKNSKQIIETKCYLNNQKQKFENEISNIKIKKKKANSNRKKYYKDLIKKYSERLNEIKLDIGKCNYFLEHLSTFPIEPLIKFLNEVITYKEGKTYVNTKLIFTESVLLIDNYIAQFKPYFIIFDSDYLKAEKELERAFVARNLAYFYKELLQDSKFIMAPAKEYEHLLSDNGMIGWFADFPYLEEIAYNLVDRRINEPDKDLQEILNEELESIKSVVAKKVKIDGFNK